MSASYTHLNLVFILAEIGAHVIFINMLLTSKGPMLRSGLWAVISF
jgi:hypothetical protein